MTRRQRLWSYDLTRLFKSIILLLLLLDIPGSKSLHNPEIKIVHASHDEIEIYTKSQNRTLKQKVAVHAVDMQVWSDCFAGCNERLTNCLTTEHITCPRLPHVTAPVNAIS